MYQYPTNDLDNPAKILRMLGSLWYETYDGRQWLLDRIQGVAENARQNHQDLEEAAAAVSRYTIPIYHRQNWRALRLLESEKNDNDAALWRFDDADLPPFDGSPEYYFDEPLTTDNFVFPWPEDVVDCRLISNRFTDPSVVLHKDIDYLLRTDRGAILFRDDPFANDAIPQRPIFESGEVVDHEILLWMFRPQIDWELPWNHLGYVLGLQMESSQQYLDLLNAVMDAVVGGTALEQIQTLAAMMAGVTLVREDGEVVEDIYSGADHQLVITDRHVYRHNLEATITVSVGDTLQAGQSLSDAFELWDFRRGELPDSLSALALGEGMLSQEFFGELIFRNQETEIVVTGSSGQERIEWDLGGHPLDVEHYWDTVHTRRLTYGDSLHDLLTADGPLPATINPLEFLAENILRNNTLVAVLRSASFGESALGLAPARLLRRITPPHVTILFILELPAMRDSATMENTDDTAIGTYDAMPLLSEEVSSQNTDDTSFSAKHFVFNCE